MEGKATNKQTNKNRLIKRQKEFAVCRKTPPCTSSKCEEGKGPTEKREISAEFKREEKISEMIRMKGKYGAK